MKRKYENLLRKLSSYSPTPDSGKYKKRRKLSKRECEVAVKLQCSFTTLPYRKVAKSQIPCYDLVYYTSCIIVI